MIRGLLLELSSSFTTLSMYSSSTALMAALNLHTCSSFRMSAPALPQVHQMRRRRRLRRRRWWWWWLGFISFNESRSRQLLLYCKLGTVSDHVISWAFLASPARKLTSSPRFCVSWLFPRTQRWEMSRRPWEGNEDPNRRKDGWFGMRRPMHSWTPRKMRCRRFYARSRRRRRSLRSRSSWLSLTAAWRRRRRVDWVPPFSELEWSERGERELGAAVITVDEWAVIRRPC